MIITTFLQFTLDFYIKRIQHSLSGYFMHLWVLKQISVPIPLISEFMSEKHLMLPMLDILGIECWVLI
jgi:hypothetical protein